MDQRPPVRTVAPAAEVVDLTLLKEHIRESGTAEDTVLQGYLDAAISYVDGWSGVLGRCLVNQTWRQDLGDWSAPIWLPFPDISSITSIAYTDAAGDSQTLASSNYELIQRVYSAGVAMKDAFDWPTLDDDIDAPVRITFVAGYGAAATDVPWPLRVAIMQIAATWYERREAVADAAPGIAPWAASALLSNYRRIGL